MAKFKVGDRVFHKPSGPSDTGTVTKVEAVNVRVKFDSDNQDGPYHPSELAHVNK